MHVILFAFRVMFVSVTLPSMQMELVILLKASQVEVCHAGEGSQGGPNSRFFAVNRGLGTIELS